MSHFTVLVIGDDYEKILAPFNEQPDEDDEDCADNIYWECDGADGETYTADTKAELEKEVADAKTTIVEGPWLNNSQGYWDWYVLGGRWQGNLRLKNKNTSGQKGRPGVMSKPDLDPLNADSALIKDIDFDGMYAEAAEKAAIIYDRVMSIFGELPVHMTFKEMRDKYRYADGTINHEEVRKRYHEQPRIIALSTVRETDPQFFINADEFLVSKEKYIEQAKLNRVATYAFIDLEGNWHAADEDEYEKIFKDTLASLSPDTRISVVDCHV